MKMIKNLFSIFIVSLLFACVSSSERVKYYSLNLDADYQLLGTVDRVNTDRPRVVVGPIHLAKFLQQDGLVMQVDAHEIYTANYHRWAEPLDEAIAKLLVQLLNTKSDYYQFGRILGPWKQNTDFHLRLEFEKFHATNNAQIVATGRYWFYTRDPILKIDQPFNISIKLTRDGYLHTVEKLKQAIDKLSIEIIASLNNLER